MDLGLNTRARLQTLVAVQSSPETFGELPARLLVDARFGDASSLLRELPCALAIAVPASPPEVTADQLLARIILNGGILFVRDGFPCLRLSRAMAVPERGFQQSGGVELPLVLSTRDFIKWQRRELVWRGGSPQRHYRLSHAI